MERGTGPNRSVHKLSVAGTALLLGLAGVAISLATVPMSSAGAASTPGWAVVPSASPAGPVLLGDSCSGPSSCVAVGYRGSPSGYSSLAEVWDGNSWSVKGPPAGTRRGTQLLSISCTSPTSCMAVGFRLAAPGQQTLVEGWNGKHWSLLPSPTIGNGGGGWFQGVSCISSLSCVAVGFQYDSKGLVLKTLAALWNGTSWTVTPSPSPGSSLNRLTSVSCVSSSSCMAVGYASSYSGNFSLAEVWDGSTWTLVPASEPGTVNNYLFGVSCPTTSACVAVGSGDNGSTGQSLVESWDGSMWSVTPTPNLSSSGLSGVSCADPTSCIAVGVNSNGTLVESWDGATWSVIPSPRPGTTSNLTAVSCLPTFGCMAAGNSYAGGLQTLFETNFGAATTTTVSVVPSTAVVDQSVEYVASVTSSTGTPTGSVAFLIGSTNVCTALLSGGSGSCSAASAPAGFDAIDAVYSGDSTFGVSLATTTLTVLSAPPSLTCAKVSGKVSTNIAISSCTPFSEFNKKATAAGSILTTGGTFTWFKSGQTTSVSLTSTSPGRGACSKYRTEYDISGSVTGGTSTYVNLNDPVALRVCQSRGGGVSLVLGTTASL